jgi:hypothetical protein
MPVQMSHLHQGAHSILYGFYGYSLLQGIHKLVIIQIRHIGKCHRIVLLCDVPIGQIPSVLGCPNLCPVLRVLQRVINITAGLASSGSTTVVSLVEEDEVEGLEDNNAD